MEHLRWLRCLFQMCPFKPMDDETGCWGECVDCGKRAGFVDSATLRRVCDAEFDARMRK